MSALDTFLLGARLVLYVVGFTVVVVAIGTIVDWAGELLGGDRE